ncbi:MAG: alpha/beta fold hydrolase [Alphaproteobacteria bacterium]|jgi:pimeloyl-ACP methyl ester carboxylesterase|nr:alpha/beta fold hydrolase [Alphaproteobacteria bacterium]
MRQDAVLGLSPAGFHRIVYSTWGATARTPDGALYGPPPVICVHGLIRNGRDFDFLAAALGETREVLCPDVVGRGRSDWLAVPAHYGYPQYCADMAALIARTGADQVDWVGTSMGGLIGLMLAAQPKSPIRRLVINDVGAFVPKAALERIVTYVANPRSFPDRTSLDAYLREVYAPFGPLSDEHWAHLVEHNIRTTEDGSLALAYDPGIGQALAAQPLDDVDLWPVWEAVRCPVLLLRGAESDVLPGDTAKEMTTRGPGAKLVEFPGIGHAPPLMTEDKITLVRDWLAA